MVEVPLVAAVMGKNIRSIVKSPTVRTISGLAGGNLLSLLIGIVGSLVQARYVHPSELGYFRAFSIATGYAFFFHLGFLDVLQRFYPYYIGRNEAPRALAIAEICQSWMVLVSGIVSCVFVCLSIRSLVDGDWKAALGWVVQSTTMASFIYGGYLGATYRAGQDFARVTRGGVIGSMVNMFILPMFPVWPYVTLALRSSLGSVINLVYLHSHRPLMLRWRINWREWVVLLGQGFPLFIASYGANMFWDVVETSIVLHFLGTQALGFWSLSFMVLEMANKVPQAMTSVYNPKVIETYGRTGKVRDSMAVCRKPLIWGTLAMGGMVAGGIAMLPVIVPFALPRYVEAVPTMSLMLFTLVLRVQELPYTILIAMGKRAQQNIAVYGGLLSFVLCALAAVQFNLGLNGVVSSSLIGRSVKIFITYRLILRSDIDECEKRMTEP